MTTHGAGYRPILGGTTSDPYTNQWAMSAWVTYTPTWTNSGSAPTLSNGTLVGGYRKHGTTLHIRGQLAIGSTTTVGTGDTRMSLPTGMAFPNVQYQVGSSFWFDSSTATLFRGVTIADQNQSYMTFQVVDTGGRAQSSGYGNGDILAWGGTFEIVA